MDEVDLDELRVWIHDAGALARQYFNHAEAHRKADRSLVTEADVAIERMVVERIAKRYPDHGIIGEEQTRQELDREFLWALDPLDGTASFVAGLPMWGVSLGLLRDGLPYLGAIYLPLLDDYYWVGPTGDAYLNDQPIHVASSEAWQNESWLAVTSNSHRRFAIDFVGKTRSLGCTAASFCYVARGSAVGAIVTRSAIWDIAAGMALLRAAGGVAIGFSGAPLDTTAMLGGELLPEPVLLAAESQIAPLHAAITDRQVRAGA